MARRWKYKYNPETLLYEMSKESRRTVVTKNILYGLGMLAFAGFFLWLYTSAFSFDLPKTAILKRENARWRSKIEIVSNQLDQNESILSGIEQRNDDVYRTIYGLDDIPQSVKNAGFGGVNRYDYLDKNGASLLLKNTIKRLDIMTKRTYVQTNALDEVFKVSRQAGDMAACIPAVPPIAPIKNTFRISSSYGHRNDPVFGKRAFHEGVDFATFLGNPVYSTGDGVVEKTRHNYFGYGNEIVINHGYGYKTRYAHLNKINVHVGQVLHRGDKIGEVGNTGKSTGPHLHYEVLHKGKPVNPGQFYDLTMDTDDFDSMVNNAIR